jgi:hypothetical protein
MAATAGRVVERQPTESAALTAGLAPGQPFSSTANVHSPTGTAHTSDARVWNSSSAIHCAAPSHVPGPTSTVA